MSEVWRKWEGQVADQKYYLEKHVGSTDHSAVFLAETRDASPRRVAVKFIAADVANAEQQLAAWESQAQLIHPNLLQMYGSGRWKMEDMDLLYVAMEYGEENLAQVLPNRPLWVEEARVMLEAATDALVFLHDKNLTHGHIKPSNILAIGDVLKLSSDTISPAGEVREMRREKSAYDAPELPGMAYTPASDMWSLGVTLVEVFSQQPAILPYNENADPIIPAMLPEPFLEIAKGTLRRQPSLRWTSAQVAARLNHTAAFTRSAIAGVGSSASATATAATVATLVATAAPAAVVALAAAAAAPAISPLDVPLSKERAIPLGKLPPATSVPMPGPSAHAKVEGEERQMVVLPSYVLPLFAAIFTLIALIALPKVLRRRVASTPTGQTAPAASVTNNAPTDAGKPPSKPVESQVKPPTPQKSLASEQIAPIPAPASAAPAPATAELRGTESAPAPKALSATATTGQGEVMDQVLPEPPAKALATITGTVRVAVKVHVDAAGNVTEANLDNPGPSKYFADMALKAAGHWVFSSPEVDGRNMPSDWLIQFFFTQDGVRATPQQVNQ